MTEPPRTPGRVHRALHAHPALSLATKVTVGVVGTLVVVAGVVMFVTPGPAVIVIPLGLAILATEFAFARRWLDARPAVGPRAPGSRPSSSTRRCAGDGCSSA